MALVEMCNVRDENIISLIDSSIEWKVDSFESSSVSPYELINS